MVDSTFNVSAGADDGYCEKTTGSLFNNSVDNIPVGNSGAVAWHCFIRFQNVTIPAGSTIDSAVLRFVADSSQSGTTVDVDIHFEDADDPAAPSNGSDVVGRSLTTGINWSGIGSWTVGNSYDSPSLVSDLQDVIDKGGWASGQSIVAHIVDNGSTANARRNPATYNHASYNAPQLIVSHHIPYAPNVSETIEVVENVSLEFDLIRNEDITLEENIDVLLGFDESLPEISENIDISEFTQLKLGISELPLITETINIIESIQIALGFKVSVFETITITETGNIQPEIETHETLTITEGVTARRGYDVDVDASFNLSDNWQLFNYAAWIRQNSARANERFFFTLTGTADQVEDAEIPISSIYARKRSGDPTYLQVVVPSFNYANEISDRASGEMIVEMGYEVGGEIALREQILIADLEDIRTDEGPVNRSVTLSGHKTISYGNNLVTFRRDQATYRSVQTRARVYRFAHVDPFVNPGDTVIVGDEQFTCDNIVYIINEFQASMEIREGS